MTTARKSAPQTTGGQGVAAPAPEIFAFPVSSGQQRLWVLERLFPGLPLFNFPVAVRMQGPLQAALLEQAVNQIVGRHEILRTSFHLQNLRLVAAVAPSLTLKLAMADLGSAPHANREVEALRWAAREGDRAVAVARARERGVGQQEQVTAVRDVVAVEQEARSPAAADHAAAEQADLHAVFRSRSFSRTSSGPSIRAFMPSRMWTARSTSSPFDASLPRER